MFSVSPAEIITIAVVALLVFGPRRLPEISRKAGKVLREIRNAANDLTAGLEAEYKDVVDPIRDARTEMRDAITGLDRDIPQQSEQADPPTSGDHPAGDGTTEGGS